MFVSTVVADIRAHVDENEFHGLRFWAKAIGKLLFTPAVQVVVLHRVGHMLYGNVLTRPFAFILRSVAIVWGGTEIHPAAQIGPGFCVVHSQKILIAEGVRIGSNVRISHGVSIGGDTGRNGNLDLAGWPVIADNVTVGLDAIVLGPVTIGEGAVVGAQSMVVRDVPARTVVMGSPARVVRRLDPPDDAPSAPAAD